MKNKEKSQSDKFKDLAREVGADEDERKFDETLRKLREDRLKDDKEKSDG